MNWFADVLRQISDLDERAIIICHAPLHDWLDDIGKSFLNITEQYRSTILNLFMGHTHYNQYQSLHDTSGEPMHVAYVGGSVVPYTGVNPSFFEYSYQRETINEESTTYLVERAVSHWIILDQANLANDTFTQWPIERYDMARDLGIPALDPESLASLSPLYVTNTTLYDTYLNAQYKGVATSDPTPALQIDCYTHTNTIQEYHSCLHQAGMKDEEIRRRQKLDQKC